MVNGVISDSTLVTSGVPQGSILGSLLFILYINDISKHILSSSTKLILYADDILLSTPFSSSSDFTAIQFDINTINDWILSHLLKFNVQKTKYMLISRKSQSFLSSLPPLFLNSSTIERVYSYKYLGVVINSNLSWSPHISSVCSKSHKILSYFFRNFYCFSSRSSLFTLYSSLVHPHLSHCSSLWDPHTKSDIKSLESIQKFALRICSKQLHSNYDRNLELFNLVPLSTRRAISKLTLLFKFINGFTFLQKRYFITLTVSSKTFQILPY